MKKKSPPSALGGSQWCFWALCGLAIGWSNAWGSADLDRQYALETIGVLKSWDNLEGLFSEYVSSAYKDYFSRQGRFLVNDLSPADPILSHSKIPYPKLIQDPQILAQLARTTRTESIIRTTISREGTQYFFTVDWLHSPQMEQIGTVHFALEEPAEGGNFGADLISGPLRENLGQLFSQVPFLANVTGRDGNAVTVNIGNQGKVKKGDVLAVATLDEVKKHPLLKTIVDWRLTPTGKVLVEQTEEGMAFCKVIEEEQGREIARYQKIVQILPGSTIEAPDSRLPSEPPPIEEPPRLGWVGFSLPVGSYNWQVNSPSNSVSNSGGGVPIGGKADGEIWLTRDWFANLGFGYSFWNFSQKNVSSGSQTAASQAGGVSGSLTSFKFDVGYSYLVRGDFLGPKGWLKVGYKTDSFSLPTSTSEFTGPVAFGSGFVGIGGDLPIRGKWGVTANFDFRVFSSVSQTWLTETTSSASDMELYLAFYYRMHSRLSFGLAFDALSNDATFSSSTTISQKTMTFAPFLLYYF